MRSNVVPLKRVSSFDPEYNPRQIVLLEDYIRQKLKSDDESPIEPFFVTDIKTASYTARFGELVRVDPTGGTFTIFLPRADDKLADSIRVVNVSTSATAVTVKTLDSDITVDLTTSYSLLGGKASAHFFPDRAGKNWMAVDGAQADLTISPASISGAQNDYTPTNWGAARYVRLTITANTVISGFGSTGISQPRKTLILASAGVTGADFYIQFLRQSTLSTAGNRLISPYPNDMYLQPDWTLDIWYDTASAAWRFI